MQHTINGSCMEAACKLDIGESILLFIGFIVFAGVYSYLVGKHQ